MLSCSGPPWQKASQHGGHQLSGATAANGRVLQNEIAHILRAEFLQPDFPVPKPVPQKPSGYGQILPNAGRHEASLLPQILSVVSLNHINGSQWGRRRRRDDVRLTQVLEQKREGAFIAAPINNTSPA